MNAQYVEKLNEEEKKMKEEEEELVGMVVVVGVAGGEGGKWERRATACGYGGRGWPTAEE